MTQLNADVASVILEYANYFEYAVLFDILFPGCRRLCYNRNIKELKTDYFIEYTLFGKLHRENDLPAFINDKVKFYSWWINGKRHREYNYPAIIDGNMHLYYQHGTIFFPPK
jgi:hypothetical protein